VKKETLEEGSDAAEQFSLCRDRRFADDIHVPLHRKKEKEKVRLTPWAL